jgi:hypothetical protein
MNDSLARILNKIGKLKPPIVANKAALVVFSQKES